jgi:uncharacterized membrane protein YphA (DoxX/SURF4 family)
MSRHYPGFLAAFFIVLLRIAIGWHFLYEGFEKVESTYGEGKEPFSAEIYLRNANGPFAPYFRAMIPDADGLKRLDPEHVKALWTAEVSRITGHFHFDADQQQKAQAVLDENLKWATYWFDDPANAEKLKKYQHEVQKINLTDADPLAMSFQKERAQDSRRALEADRRSLLAPFNDQEKILHDSVAKLATPDQLKSAGESSVPLSSLDIINQVTMFGLVAIGICLILGFLTPLAALAAAAFLAMIYFSMPPWPGLPPNPKAEGHYWIVSKNLVEMLACLVIATTRSGHWIGFDALVFRRRRRQQSSAPAARHEVPTAQQERPVLRDEQPIALDQ